MSSSPRCIRSGGSTKRVRSRRRFRAFTRHLKQDLFLVKDLYVVYEGRNDETGRPIIKAHLNPMVPWIWIGLSS